MNSSLIDLPSSIKGEGDEILLGKGLLNILSEFGTPCCTGSYTLIVRSKIFAALDRFGVVRYPSFKGLLQVQSPLSLRVIFEYLDLIKAIMPKLKLPLLLLFTAFIISCSKDSNVNPYKAIFQYKVNGNLITIHNISIAAGESATFMKRWQGNGSPPSRYSFNGQKGVDNTWYFSILSDSLQVRNYTYDSTYQYTPFMNYNGQPSGLYFNGDYMKINITSYANGYISGDFTAKLTPIKEPGGSSADYSKKGTTLITEGLFKNIPCSY